MTAFLFTDVVDSTRLWERMRDRMPAALREHDRIVEHAVFRNRGRVVRPRGEGDSRFAVFTDVAGALAAALDIQRDLKASGCSLAVRASVHVGEADYVADDFYGPEVNKGARLRGLAGPGGVMVSEATAAAARGRLPGDAGLLDLGPIPLRGCSEPERVFALTHPDLGVPRVPTLRERLRRFAAFVLDEILAPDPAGAR